MRWTTEFLLGYFGDYGKGCLQKWKWLRSSNFPLDWTTAYKSGDPGTCFMTCSQARREFSSRSFCWSLVLSGSLAHMSPFNNSFAYIILEKGSLRRSDPFQGLLWSCFLPESYQAGITLELLMSFLGGWNGSPPSLPEPETLSLF